MLLQIETDKVTIDVRYTESQPGTIKEYLVSEEDTVTVGQDVCIVDKGATEGAGGSAEGDLSACLWLAAMHNLTKLEPVAQLLILATIESRADSKPEKEEKTKEQPKEEKPKEKEPAKADLNLEERPKREAEKPEETTKKAPPAKVGFVPVPP